MKIYHVTRDLGKSLRSQKRELAAMYKGFIYIGSNGRQIDFIAEGRR